MTYEDFYKLLKIDRHGLSKSMSAVRVPNSRGDLAESMPDVDAMTRRHSLIDLAANDSPVVSKVKTYRKLQSVILDASKYATDDKAHSKRPNKRPSLILRRSAHEGELSLLCKSIDTLTIAPNSTFG